MENVKIGDVIRKNGEDFEVLEIRPDGIVCRQPDTYFIHKLDLQEYEITVK